MNRRDFLTMPAGMKEGALLPPEIDGDDRSRSIRYLAGITGMMRAIRATQSAKILEAAHAVARTRKSGGTCRILWDMGHSATADIFPTRNGDPELFVHGYDATAVKPGDLFLSNLPEYPPFDDIVAKDIFVIGGPCAWGGDGRFNELVRPEIREMLMRPYADIWIETGITAYGAFQKIPGMPAPLGPVSGALGMYQYQMIAAEACRLLARDGITVPVKGDDPPLASDTPRVKPDVPLLRTFHDRVMTEIEMILAEMGALREMARMIADSILSGGKVYGYSRWPGALAGEADYRRGGLLLTRGLHDSDGEPYSRWDFTTPPNSCVIMGITKPDDEIDMKHLGTFHKRGMKVATIGPMTRNGRVPAGRTAPKESDVHAGRMCDTYGLFAVDRFERKVAPTSGILTNLMFWAMCHETADEIIRRTGDAPGVLFSSALAFGRDHNRRIEALYAARGY